MAVVAGDLNLSDRAYIFDYGVSLSATCCCNKGAVLDCEFVGFVGNNTSDTAKHRETATEEDQREDQCQSGGSDRRHSSFSKHRQYEYDDLQGMKRL